jgi:hypothetical protein
MITIAYRLLKDRVIIAPDSDGKDVVPAGTVFELPAGLDPGKDVEVIRRRKQERKVA